jgi:protein TonB
LPAAAEKAVSRRKVDLPALAAANFATARTAERLPPPAEIARAASVEQTGPPDRPEFTPPKKSAEAQLRPRETTTSVESAASTSAAASSGVRESKAPRAVFSVDPVYPPEALAAGIEGIVKIRVRVDATGRVVEADVYQSSGYAVLDAAALNVIYRWRFSPPDGERGVAAEFVHPFEFDDKTIRRR